MASFRSFVVQQPRISRPWFWNSLPVIGSAMFRRTCSGAFNVKHAMRAITIFKKKGSRMMRVLGHLCFELLDPTVPLLSYSRRQEGSTHNLNQAAATPMVFLPYRDLALGK
ncbi:hypothetical protein AA313_de0200929 [Arthrobotrys entomopaga]|nr:hypothetical protein AA313_de0200929 [Arthrobotrys entomopaga]